MVDLNNTGEEAESKADDVEVPLTEEDLHEIKVKEAKRQIEMDRYLMIDDEAKKSGITKSVIIVAVTGVIVFLSLFFSVLSSVDQDWNSSETTDKNRKLYLNSLYEKNASARKDGSSLITDFRFDNNKLLISFALRSAETGFSGELTPLDVKKNGKEYLAQSLCSDGLEKIRRNLAIDEVDYLFYHDKVLLYTVKATVHDCNALK